MTTPTSTPEPTGEADLDAKLDKLVWHARLMNDFESDLRKFSALRNEIMADFRRLRSSLPTAAPSPVPEGQDVETLRCMQCGRLMAEHATGPENGSVVCLGTYEEIRAELQEIEEANGRMAEGIQRWVQAFGALVPEEAKARVDAELASLRTPLPGGAAEIAKMLCQRIRAEGGHGFIVHGIAEKLEAALSSLSPVPVSPSAEHEYALRLATIMARKHWPEIGGWKPLPDLMGLLTQIDNMVAGMVRRPAPVPAAEDVRDNLIRELYALQFGPMEDREFQESKADAKWMGYWGPAADRILSLLVPAPSNTQERK